MLISDWSSDVCSSDLELVDQIEQFVGLVRGDIVGFGTAFDKDRALRVHLGLDLLAHRAAQQIGATERITRQDLRGLHHLFLIDEDAVGFLEDAFRSEEHTSELQSLMRISYAVFCLKKKTETTKIHTLYIKYKEIRNNTK